MLLANTNRGTFTYNVVGQDPGHVRTPISLTEFPTPFLYSAFFQPSTMSVITKEAKIILAIEAIRTSKRLSRRKAAKLYGVPFSTLTLWSVRHDNNPRFG